MQGPPLQKDIRLPYSKWSQHRADNGLIYLAHPVTGEVKWLWSRHHDPNTEHDYLVNTITGKRQWVTKENAHFCPVRPDAQTNSPPNSNVETPANPPNPSLVNATEKSPQPQTSSTAAALNHFVNMPTPPAKVATASNPDPIKNKKPKYREIAAPKSLGLTADEVLMLVPDTGRRYVFNKKTKTSRWLPHRPPDTITDEKRQRSLFGRSKQSKQPPSQLRDDDDIDPELKTKTRALIMPTEHSESNASNGAAEHVATDDAVTKPAQHRVATNSHRDFHSSQRVKESRTSQLGTDDDDKREVDEISSRLDSLNTILEDVSKLTTSDKYNLAKLRGLSNHTTSEEQARAGSQRLLELEEYLTQQMLKVDAVESEGNHVIRAKRKETVKAILALTEEIERLREQLSS